MEESDEFEAVDVEVTRNRPTFEKCNIGQVSLSPSGRTPTSFGKRSGLSMRTT